MQEIVEALFGDTVCNIWHPIGNYKYRNVTLTSPLIFAAYKVLRFLNYLSDEGISYTGYGVEKT